MSTATKDELKARIDLVELISRTVQLKKDGNCFKGLCPLHNDTHPSLCVWPDQRRWECFGCGRKGDCYSWIQETERTDFRGALDRLQGEYGDGIVTAKTQAATTWNITDVDGNILAQHLRIDLPSGKKTYEWRHKDGTKSKDGEIKPARLPLYGLANLFSSPATGTIIIVEGEKAADALIKQGHTAVGTVTGAASCPDEEAFHPLVGFNAKVCPWPDNDPPGYAHMDKVAKHLLKLGIEPYLIRWEGAPPKGDAYDFISANGLRGALTVEDLLADAKPWPIEQRPSEKPMAVDEAVEQSIRLLSGHTIRLRAVDIRRERTGVHARVSVFCDSTLLAWDTFNVQRDAERNRLAKSAVERLPEGLDTLCDAPTLKGHLDQFAADVWPIYLGSTLGAPMVGLQELSRLPFILTPYIVSEAGTIIFAPPGRGKSYLALCMAVCIDAGLSTFWPVQQSRVLFVNIERSESSLQRRLTMVNKCLGLDQTRPLHFLNERGKSLLDIADRVKATIRKYGTQVLFLDSISRAGMGSLIEDQTANKCVDILNSLSPTWVAIGHTSKADEGRLFGSVHFTAGCDVEVGVLTQEKANTLGLGLQVTKANDISRGGDMFTMAFEFQDTVLTAIRKARPFEFGELAMNRKISPTQEIKQYLLEKGEDCAKEIAENLHRNYSNVVALLNGSDEFIKTRKEGKVQFWGVKAEIR